MEEVKLKTPKGVVKTAYIGSFDGKEEVVLLSPYNYDISKKEAEKLFKGKPISITDKKGIFGNEESNVESMLIPLGVKGEHLLNVCAAFSHFKGESVKGGGWWVFDEKALGERGAVIAFPNRLFPDDNKLISAIKKWVPWRNPTPLVLGVDKATELVGSRFLLCGGLYTLHYKSEATEVFLKSGSGSVYTLQKRTDARLQELIEDKQYMEDNIINDPFFWHRIDMRNFKKEPKACLESIVRSVVYPDPEEIYGTYFEWDDEYLDAVSRPCYKVFVENIGDIILESDDASRRLPELSAHHVKSLCEGKTIKVKLPSFSKESGCSSEDGSTFIISPNNFDKVRYHGAYEIVKASRGGWGLFHPQTLYINIEKVKSMDNKKSKNAEKNAKSVEEKKPSKSVRIKAF